MLFMAQNLTDQARLLMKVAELKKGDMLFPIPGMRFLISSYSFSENEPWVRVVETKSFRRFPRSMPDEGRFMIYLGTKKDTGATASWSNRFCLLDNRVVAVEPSCWKWIEKRA